MEVHLDQCVSYKMSEAAAIEEAVGAGVVLAVIDLRELKTSILMKILPVEVLMGTEDLHREKRWLMRLCIVLQFEYAAIMRKTCTIRTVACLHKAIRLETCYLMFFYAM